MRIIKAQQKYIKNSSFCNNLFASFKNKFIIKLNLITKMQNCIQLNN